MQNAPLVQLVERWSPKPNVVGSSPTGRGVFYIGSDKLNLPVANLSRIIGFTGKAR